LLDLTKLSSGACDRLARSAKGHYTFAARAGIMLDWPASTGGSPSKSGGLPAFCVIAQNGVPRETS
jgi:hypothetical protein